MRGNFDPTHFFLDTAYYPSTARAAFRISKPPVVLTRAAESHDLIKKGLEYLLSGRMAFAVTLPPRSLNTSEGVSYTGPARKIPNNIIFSDLEIQFYLMGSTREHADALYRTLVYWQEHITGYRKHGSNRTYSDTSFTSTFFSLEYYDNYVSNARVDLYHQSSTDPIRSFVYHEMYPLNIGSMQTNWSQNDQPATIPVTFTYHYEDSLASMI